jgi:hypothetical protein
MGVDRADLRRITHAVLLLLPLLLLLSQEELAQSSQTGSQRL